MVRHAVIGICMALVVSAAYAQNCTVTPAMNRVSIAAGNSVIGNASAGTIEVQLAQNFTSQTGYMQIYAAGATWPAGPSSGYSGSYPITSGNGTADVFVKAVSVANPNGFALTSTGQSLVTGSTTGSTVSDLKVVKVSARKYTIEWSTPGYNSTTNMSYGSDADTLGLPGGFGFNWPSQDTTTGVNYHSITIDNLVPGGIAAGNGIAPFTVWSECFNSDGTINKQLYASMPGGNPYSNQAIVTAPVDVVPGQNTYTMANSPGMVQDGIHNGVRGVPGGNVIIPLYWNDTTVPTSGYVHYMNVAVTDWNTGVGLLTNFGASGQYYRGTGLQTWGSNGNFTVTQDNNYSGNLYLHIPANAATTGTGCTSAGGDSITVDGSTAACAYPLKISATPWGGSSCATVIICGPPGTTTTQPVVTKIWVIVYNVPVVPRNPVGPWTNPNTMTAGIPCEREANKGPTIDNCRNLSAGLSGVYNNYFSYEGNQNANCTWNGAVQPIWVNINTSNWFYDGGYVCHTLDLLGYPKPGGGNRDQEEHHILGAELEYWYPRRVDYALFASFTVSAPATLLTNPACATVASSDFLQQCSGMQLSVGSQDVTPIANALAAGTVLRACFNIPTNTLNRPYYTGAASGNPCQVLARPPVPTLTLTPGGSLPASTTYSLGQYYVAASGILSYYSGPATVTTDSTCPTSGRCSIDVSSLPTTANATGWCVYANLSGQSYFQYCTPTSPLMIGTDLVLDGPVGGAGSHPFQNTNIATVSSWGTSGMYITAADTVNHTITVDSRLNASLPTTAGYAPSQPTTGSTIIVVRAGGMIADAGSSTSQILCASCNFANVVANSSNPTKEADTAYCGVVAGDLNESVYTTAPQRGSQIVSKTATTLNLSTAINCGPGVPFEIHYRQPQQGFSRIYMWTSGFYDVFERQQNHIAADAIIWLASSVAPGGSGPPWSPVFQYAPATRREDALSMRACQLAMHIMNEVGTGNSPFPPSPLCTYPAPLNPDFWPQNGFQRIDAMVDNGEGNGSAAGSYLNGLIMYTLAQWWLDPLMNAQSDARYVYWIKKLADFMWPYYYAANARSIPSACNNKYLHEWAYFIDSPRLGIACLAGTNSTATINGNAIWDYWSIYGNVLPAYAFLYWYTGNAQIPTSNAVLSNYTYGQAYADMASWIFIYMANQTGFITGAGDKTLGEMGVWQNQALGWMGGNMGVTPSPLTITTSSLPPATAGTAYSATMAASGGTPPYTWTSSTLPANGLTIDSSGTIGGTPLAAGTTPVTATVTDAASGTASTSLSITVSPAPVQPTYPSYITGVIP